MKIYSVKRRFTYEAKCKKISNIENSDDFILEEYRSILFAGKYGLWKWDITTAIKNIDNIVRLLKDLKNIDIKITLDVFRTGYFSLSYLRELPLNTIKIDKSFMDNIEKDFKKKAIIKSISILSK